MSNEPIRVGVKGYGVIGKRAADAVTLQDDMDLVGVADVGFDYRVMTAVERGYPVYAAMAERSSDMEAAGIPVAGILGICWETSTLWSSAHPRISGPPGQTPD